MNRVFSLRKLVFISILLAILVVSLGAYTRLTHAGLGCPDWPGCYGLIDVPETAEQIDKAQQAFPDRLVEPEKAWNEMIHRYFAGSLGLLILAIAIICVKQRNTGSPVKLPLTILAVVIFQAALGMWTVTMKLMPIVVMGHLLGGFTTLCLLFILYLRLGERQKNKPVADAEKLAKLKKPALIGVFILVLQIALGGWTSSNYAALVCTELPICQAGWQSQLTFADSFDLIPPHRDSYEFGHLDHDERLTIHVMHRFGAIITAVYLAWLALLVFKSATSLLLKRSAGLLLAVLSVQVGLGISNIWFSLPLFVAVSHNVVAACLMLVLLSLTYKLFNIGSLPKGKVNE
ncbi:MAG: COX15/CtaA family protein [Thalassotalea sp.]